MVLHKLEERRRDLLAIIGGRKAANAGLFTSSDLRKSVRTTGLDTHHADDSVGCVRAREHHVWVVGDLGGHYSLGLANRGTRGRGKCSNERLPVFDFDVRLESYERHVDITS
jgi:hypothetical protein